MAKSCFWSVLFFVAVSINQPARADVLEEGEKLYAAGQYSQAAGLLYSYANANPDSAAGQYMLANSFVGLQRTDEALDRYKKVVKLAPKSKIAQYSMQQIKKIEDLQKAAAAAENPQPSASSAQKFGQAIGATGRGAGLSSGSTESQEKAIQADYDARIKVVTDDEQSKIKRLAAERDEVVSNLGYPLRGKGGTVWRPDPGPANSDYDAKVAALRKETTRRVDELKLECTSRINSFHRQD